MNFVMVVVVVVMMVGVIALVVDFRAVLITRLCCQDVSSLVDEVSDSLGRGEDLGFLLARVGEEAGDTEQLERELEELQEEDRGQQGSGRREEQDLLAELAALTVHDSSLEPVIVPGQGRREAGSSAVAL